MCSPILLAFVAGWLELCDVSTGQWGVNGNGVCCSRAVTPLSSPLPLLQKQVLERWYHTRIEFPRVPRWQHGAETLPTSPGHAVWAGPHVKSLLFLGHIVVATRHRQINPVLNWWGVGFTPGKPLQFPFEVLVIRLRLNTDSTCDFIFEWQGNLAGTKEKTLKVIFCWNMVIVNWRFSLLCWETRL